MSGQRVLITGATGMLGSALTNTLSASHDCVAIFRGRPGGGVCRWRQADLLDRHATEVLLRREAPDVVIHSAAMTNVDACERDHAGTWGLHVETTEVLAEYCVRRNAQLIYISTDAVYNGKKIGPYLERDATGPLNLYGFSKLAGEAYALACGRGLVLRSNIFGWRPQRHDSFGEWVLGALRNGTPLTMFTDVLFTPIATAQLSRIIESCIKQELTGLYNAGGSEVISKCEFAYRVASAYGLSTDNIQPILVSDKPLAAERPRNMALDSGKLAARLGYPLPDVTQSIRAWQETEPAHNKEI